MYLLSTFIRHFVRHCIYKNSPCSKNILSKCRKQEKIVPVYFDRFPNSFAVSLAV